MDPSDPTLIPSAIFTTSASLLDCVDSMGRFWDKSKGPI